MGVVYRAHDERLDRDVALKVLPAGSLSDDDARRRFRKEALALSKLNHPHIATIHDFDSQGGIDFLVMELISGQALSHVIRDGGLSDSEVRDLSLQLADGLVALHGLGSSIGISKQGTWGLMWPAGWRFLVLVLHG